MKCKLFIGLSPVSDFNAWAKGKLLSKDIIIHTVSILVPPSKPYSNVAIVVYYREGSSWDTEPEEKLTAPIHMTPTEKYVKVDEMEVT